MIDHTPGPWEVRETRQFIKVISKDGITICSDEDFPAPLDKADAHLIAAAPDMLAALKQVRTRALPPEITDMVYDAIAKAEGKL